MANIDIATPLNNGDINPVSEILWKTTNDKLITKDLNTHYILDTNGVIPPKVSSSTTVTYFGYDHDINITDPSSTYYVVQDENGELWYFIAQSFNSSATNKYALFKISVDDDGNTVIDSLVEDTLNFTPSDSGMWSESLAQYRTGTLFTNVYQAITSGGVEERIHICSNGYIKIEKKIGGGLEIINDSFNGIETSDYYDECRYIQDNYLYWIDGTDIYRTLIQSGNSHETIYSNPSIVNPVNIEVNGSDKSFSLTVSGDNIIFYQYLSAINIGTYSLPLGTSDPILLEENQANVKNIVQLTF